MTKYKTEQCGVTDSYRKKLI